jgi:hypothetical protein
MNVKLSNATTHRIMQKLEFSYITPSPRHHKQDPKLRGEFKKNLVIEKSKLLFFFDESRFGTHSKAGHGWFKKRTSTPAWLSEFLYL